MLPALWIYIIANVVTISKYLARKDRKEWLIFGLIFLVSAATMVGGHIFLPKKFAVLIAIFAALLIALISLRNLHGLKWLELVGNQMEDARDGSPIPFNHGSGFRYIPNIVILIPFIVIYVFENSWISDITAVTSLVVLLPVFVIRLVGTGRL